MKTRVLAIILALTGTALAQPDKKQPPSKPAAPATPKAPADAPKPSKDDEMKMYQEWASPAKEHAHFKDMVGTWNAQVKMWEPGQTEPSGTSTGVMVNTLNHGGRYIHHEYKGEMEGAPFTGSGDFGFNKATGKYEGTWTDNWSTAIMFTTGTYDEKTKTFTSTGEMIMPGPDGKPTKCQQRETVKIESPDKHVMEMFMTMGGQEMKMMEITYTRATDSTLKKTADDASHKIKDAAERNLKPGK